MMYFEDSFVTGLGMKTHLQSPAGSLQLCKAFKFFLYISKVKNNILEIVINSSRLADFECLSLLVKEFNLLF